MTNPEYNGVGAEWLQPLLEIEREQDEKLLSQNHVVCNEKTVVPTRCERTIDMFADLEEKRSE